ncbi:hypothetical protein [Oceanithermus sp.]
MSEYATRLGLLSELLGDNREVQISKDGKSVTVSGEIASRIKAGLTIRPSDSTGVAADFRVGGTIMRHAEGYK